MSVTLYRDRLLKEAGERQGRAGALARRARLLQDTVQAAGLKDLERLRRGEALILGLDAKHQREMVDLLRRLAGGADLEQIEDDPEVRLSAELAATHMVLDHKGYRGMGPVEGGNWRLIIEGVCEVFGPNPRAVMTAAVSAIEAKRAA